MSQYCRKSEVPDNFRGESPLSANNNLFGTLYGMLVKVHFIAIDQDV
jgi:hypothetical protein